MSKGGLVGIIMVCALAISIVIIVTVPQLGCDRPPAHTPPTHGLQFDGINNHMTASWIPAVTNNGTYTFSAWIYPTADDGKRGRHVFENSAGGGDRNGMVVASGTVRFGYYDGSAYVAVSGEIALDQWTHVVGINDSGSVSLYMDTALQTGTEVPYIGAFADAFLLGTNSMVEEGSFPFEGIISQVHVYSRVLSGEEISRLYRHEDVTDGLVAYWKLDDGEGIVAQDSSLINNHGTVHGEPVWFGSG